MIFPFGVNSCGPSPKPSLQTINFTPPTYPTPRMNITHKLKPFQQLTVNELYDLLRLRSEVFVVEQNCVFLDQDNKDQLCYHLLLFAGDKLAAYCRLVPAGVSYPEISIGRVITSPDFRGSGLGRKVMELAIESCLELFGAVDIRIGAQTYALPFYTSLGFIAEGNVYDEDGIEHIEMVKTSKLL
ncbi:GNAT family N-acetyltransferase [Mucilaginibacter sp. FT3.2]|uniref:GNAT family N-acetyltransferase n=1 Tax=Mucilaginibacter sp. FT3.2 TaxID=2723090 RepID=UPI001842BF7B|nr:GNAT family N-acetyltransferase [Mucilaginibacter sp. FT3.2]MBB6230580.1 ElaA protein [Mucilaginibacter sp. FT3.2]